MPQVFITPEEKLADTKPGESPYPDFFREFLIDKYGRLVREAKEKKVPIGQYIFVNQTYGGLLKSFNL